MVRYEHGIGFGFAGWIGPIVMIVVWVAVIVLVIWAISALLSSSRRPPPQAREPREDSALRILRERYARGEIDTEQFEQARRALGGGDGSLA